VVYDDAGGSIAARLWWMLRILDHEVAVLDGGIDAWIGPLTTADVRPDPASSTARVWPADRIVDADGVEALRTRRDALVLDARAATRYANGDPAVDPRPGHIPAARNAPWAGNVDPDTGLVRSPGELRRRYADLGAPDAHTI